MASRFIREADAIVASTIDHRQPLQRVAELVVPRLADWCLIGARGRDGGMELVASADVGGGRSSHAEELYARCPPAGGSPRRVEHALEDGEPVLIHDVAEALDEPSTVDPDALRIHVTLGIRSAIFVPLLRGAKVVGAMRLYRGADRPRYDARDLDTARALALRAGRIYEHACLLEELNQDRSLRDALLESVGHELRTPLGALVLSLQSIGDDLSRRELVSRGQLVTKADRALRQARQLVDLVEMKLGILGDSVGRTRSARSR